MHERWWSENSKDCYNEAILFGYDDAILFEKLSIKKYFGIYFSYHVTFFVFKTTKLHFQIDSITKLRSCLCLFACVKRNKFDIQRQNIELFMLFFSF